MKKWEEQNRAKAHQKRVSSAKSTLSKNATGQILNVKSPSNLGKEQFIISDQPESYPSPLQSDGSVSTRPASSKISDYYEFEKENLTNIPLYKLLKHHSLQQYAKALISRGYGYDLIKLIGLHKDDLNALMTDIKIMPGHKVKFTKMVSQIGEIYSEMIEQDPDRPKLQILEKGLNVAIKPTTAQTTRSNNRPMSGMTRTHLNKPNSANPGMRRQPQSKPPSSQQTRRQNPSMGHIPAPAQSGQYKPHMIRKIQAIGLDYFSDSQESMDDEFSKALSGILKQYEEDPVDISEPKKVTPRSQTQPQSQVGSHVKPKPSEKPEDLMSKVEKMYSTKDPKPTQTQKPKTTQPPVEDKSKDRPKPNTTTASATTTAIKDNTRRSEVIKKAADDLDLDLGKKKAVDDFGDFGKKKKMIDDLIEFNKKDQEESSNNKARVMDLLEKKLDANHLNADDLNVEFKKIKDMYSSFEGATMTSTIANIDIEEMCYCFACAVQKHIEYFTQNILPTYTPLETRPIKKEPELEKKPSGKSTTTTTVDDPQFDDSCGIEYEEGASYFVYKGQKIPKGKVTEPNMDNESLVNLQKLKESRNLYTHDDEDEVMIAESGNNIAEEEKLAETKFKREQSSEEVLYEDNGEYNEENFQDFLRQSLRNSMMISGVKDKKDYYPTESDLIRKYNLDVPFQPVTTTWNIVDEKTDRDRFTQSQSGKTNDDEDEPEEDIPDDDDEDEERDEAKISKSYFSFEESQFIDVELSAQEMDLQKRTRLVFEKTFNERNLTPQDISKRIGDVVDNAVISNFCKNLMVTTKMEKEVVIVSLVYVERLILKTNMYLTSLNWKRICFTAFVISSKIWDDESFENQHFAKVFPQYSIKEINELEKVFLEFIDYDLRVSGSDYAKYYFIMRNFAEKNKKSFSLKALNVQTVRLLQKKTENTAKSLKELHGDPLNKTFA